MPREELTQPAGKYFHKYLDFAIALISRYNGIEPFHLYLRKYFSSHKKHGSKDRKQVASLCYNYFRLGFGVNSKLSLNETLLLGTFLCESIRSPILAHLKPNWNDEINGELTYKLKVVESYFHTKNIFPFTSAVSNEIDSEEFATSFFKKPKLFIRIRPGKEVSVLDKLRTLNCSFKKLNDRCLAFSHNVKISDVLKIDEDAVIQDYNSQRVGEFLLEDTLTRQTPLRVWDCCAGSGGKSILAVDMLKNIQLTVTDKRSSILSNLQKRFAAAGIEKFNSFVFDVTSHKELPIATAFDLIIADVPCSGSGTWSRTPEQLRFFHDEEIEKYSLLQRQLIDKVVPHLEQNGTLLYITCSVFKKENEENVDYILRNFPLILSKAEYLKGYEMHADTLFIAVFRSTTSVSTR